jgi:hypothetical protein
MSSIWPLRMGGRGGIDGKGTPDDPPEADKDSLEHERLVGERERLVHEREQLIAERGAITRRRAELAE